MNNLMAALAEAKARQPKPKRVQREHPFQTAAFEFATLVLPPDAIITSLDHANASKVANAMNAARGVLKGIPDMLITWSPDPIIRLHVNAWIETKATKGRLSTAQEAWRDALLASGAYWCAPRTLSEVADFLASTPIPLRKVSIL